jgi:fucose 4-O-acetylase-like acetyltransferase
MPDDPPAATRTAARNSGIDLLRVIGICAVVYGHVVTTEATAQWIYPWHVPLFFFLSGWFWKRGRPLRADLRSRAKSLLVPYAFWLVIGLGLLWAMGLLSPDGLLAILRGGASAKGIFAAFWFVTALFWASVFARLLEPLPQWVAWAVAILGTGATYLLPLGALPLALGQSFPGLLFLLFGALAARFRVTWWVGLVLLAGAVSIIAFAPVAYFNLKSMNLGTPVVGVALAVAISWGLALTFAQVRAAWATVPASAGIAVVLFHTFVLFFAAQWGLPVAVTLIVVLVASWGVAIGLRFTPLSQLANGQPRLRRGGAGRTSR